MFYGTRFFYKFLYFITSMSPAYLLFLAQLNSKYEEEILEFLKFLNLSIYSMLLSLLAIFILLSIFLKSLLKHQLNAGKGERVIGDEEEEFYDKNITEKNSNVTSFLLGNILPAALIVENDFGLAIFVFIFIQIIIFNLIMKSTDIFPNVLLIIFGVDLYKTKNGKFLFVFRSSKHRVTEIYHLGNTVRSRMYITSFKK